MNNQSASNKLGTENTGSLLRQFAIPSIIAMLVSSLYNIVDQFFIGQAVGSLGNAATNIAFPLSISCVAIALLFGIGGASAFNISMGRGEKEEACGYMGCAIVLMLACGVCLSLFTQILLTPILKFFGSPADVLPLAETYTRITSLGFPFLIFQTGGGGHLVRADGRPRTTMLINMTGALINTVLDALFVFGFGWGIAGAAAATVIGQMIAFVLSVWCLAHCKSVTLARRHLRVVRDKAMWIASLGTAPCTNQLAMMCVQIVMNNSLKYYGAMSVYGESIPIACAGIISKVNMLFMSFIIGISQGLQPITSFNFGAQKYDRVKSAYLKAVGAGAILAVTAFALFQIFPRQIISFFGKGNSEYYRFAVNYFHIFLFFTFLNFIQPITSNFFTSIAKPRIGTFLSLTRQIIFLLPLILIFPLFMGIDGIMFAGPAADLAAALTAVFLVIREFRKPEYHSSSGSPS